MATYTLVNGYIECAGNDITSLGIYNAVGSLSTGTATKYESGNKHFYCFSAPIRIGYSVQSKTFTASTDDTITSNGHTLLNNNTITFSSTGTLPGGLSTSTTYYVINATTNTFKVSLTQGGSAVDITSTGSGTHTWTREDTTAIWDCSQEHIGIVNGGFQIYGGGEVKQGELVSSLSKNGGSFSATMTGNDQFRLYSKAKLLIYGSYIYISHRVRVDSDCTWTTVDCDMEAEDGVSLSDGWISYRSVVTYDNSRIHHTNAVGVKLYANSAATGSNKCTFSVENIKVEGCKYAFQTASATVLAPVIKNAKIDSCTYHLVPNLGNSEVTFVNPDFTTLRIYASNSSDITKIEFEYDVTFRKNSDSSLLENVRMYLTDEQDDVRYNGLSNSSGKPVSFEGTFQNSTYAGTTRTTRALHKVKYRKYGYLYIDGNRNAVANNSETVRLLANNNVVATETVASNISGITIDTTNKEIKVTSSNSLQNVYDYTQWWGTQSGNIQYPELLTTVDKANFTLASGWDLVLEDELTSTQGKKVTGDVYLNDEIDLTNITINGDLHINTGANSELDFDNVTVTGNITNDDSSHTLTINATNGSSVKAKGITEWKSPGTLANDTAVGTQAWDNPSNAGSSNNQYAHAESSTSSGTWSTSNYLKATNFGFSIPSGASIAGIEVRIERHKYYDAKDNEVKIIKGGTVGSENKASSSGYPSSDAFANYGGSSDLWSETWTRSNINSSNFGVVLSSSLWTEYPPDRTHSDAYIDVIQIKVYYSNAGTGNGEVNIQRPVTLKVTALDDKTGSGINNAHVIIQKESDKTTVKSGQTNSSGIYEVTHYYDTDIPIVGWVRQWDLSGDDYIVKTFSGTITNQGLEINTRLTPI